MYNITSRGFRPTARKEETLSISSFGCTNGHVIQPTSHQEAEALQELAPRGALSPEDCPRCRFEANQKMLEEGTPRDFAQAEN